MASEPRHAARPPHPTLSSWDRLDWSILDRLRERFLSGTAASAPYWQSDDDLAQYDLTYGERIGWKWDAVLGELRRRRWQPPTGTVLDWGCGSGVAGRRFAAAWPHDVLALRVWDHSPLARRYAAARARADGPVADVAEWTASSHEPIAALIVSHVLNELDADSRDQLAAVIDRAETVLWVEPGTSEVARGLVGWRERSRGVFRFVLPCPHDGACGLLAPGNERHWCHHFAAPPSGIFADPHWVRFGQRAGIDLRSLPYSCLVMERRTRPVSAPLPADASRVLGRPEHFKPYVRLLDCSATGVAELTLPKRADPVLHRRLDKPGAPRLWRWDRDGTTLRGGEPVPGPEEPGRPPTSPP